MRQSPLFLPWSKCQMPVMHALHLKLTSTMSAQSRCLYLLLAHHHRCKLARVSSSSKGFPFGCRGHALLPIGARLDSAFIPIDAAWPLALSRALGGTAAPMCCLWPRNNQTANIARGLGAARTMSRGRTGDRGVLRPGFDRRAVWRYGGMARPGATEGARSGTPRR